MKWEIGFVPFSDDVVLSLFAVCSLSAHLPFFSLNSQHAFSLCSLTGSYAYDAVGTVSELACLGDIPL